MTKDTAQSKPDSSLVARPSSLGLEEARTLVASPLWPRIRAFLWDFASLCDPERLTAALSPSGGSGALPRSLSNTSRAAKAAEKALGLTPFFHFFPSDDGSRLLLLSREDYDRLAQFLGTVALAPSLRLITAGADVRALKAALPGVYPEALTFAAYFHRHEPLFKQVASKDESGDSSLVTRHSSLVTRHSSLPTAVPATGHAILASALSNLPPELLLRQRLRFPVDSPADQALLGGAGGDAPRPLQEEAMQAARLALKLFLPSEFSILSA